MNKLIYALVHLLLSSVALAQTTSHKDVRLSCSIKDDHICLTIENKSQKDLVFRDQLNTTFPRGLKAVFREKGAEEKFSTMTEIIAFDALSDNPGFASMHTPHTLSPDKSVEIKIPSSILIGKTKILIEMNRGKNAPRVIKDFEQELVLAGIK